MARTKYRRPEFCPLAVLVLLPQRHGKVLVDEVLNVNALTLADGPGGAGPGRREAATGDAREHKQKQRERREDGRC